MLIASALPSSALASTVGDGNCCKCRLHEKMHMKKLIAPVLGLVMFFAATEGHAMDELRVMISGGFSLAYHDVLPEFERSTGIAGRWNRSEQSRPGRRLRASRRR